VSGRGCFELAFQLVDLVFEVPNAFLDGLVDRSASADDGFERSDRFLEMLDLEPQGLVLQIPAIRGNAELLSHAISNLVYNAIKFVSRVTSPEVNIRSERRGEWLRLQVEDNGRGIAPRDQERLFQIFQRLSTAYPGTGIGLAVVRKCVQRMNGRVGIDSVLGSGSKFWIELPLANE